jgi:hypothetical protein
MPSANLPYVAPGPPPGAIAAPALFHLSGAPVRAAVCSAVLFTPTPPAGGGPAVSPIYGQVDRRLWELPGIYCLLWPPTPAGQTPVYVGSCRDFFARLIGHPKVGWSTAVLLTGHGVGLAAAEQAESAVGRVLLAAQPAGVIAPLWTKHPRPWGADMPWHLFEPLVVLLNRCLATATIGLAVRLDPRVARL